MVPFMFGKDHNASSNTPNKIHNANAQSTKQTARELEAAAQREREAEERAAAAERELQAFKQEFERSLID